MKNLFIPYPLAVLAKEKGFNEPCIAKFFGEDKYIGLLRFESKNSEHEFNPVAPLYQQIVDWLRIKHLLITIDYTTMSYVLVDMRRQNCLHDTGGIGRVDFDKAIEEAFKLI